MKNTIQVLVVLFSVVLSVSFIGFNRSLNESEMTEANSKASGWLKKQLQNNEYGKFLSTIELDEDAELTKVTLEVRSLVDSFDCSSLNKVITIGEDEVEAIQDFKVGIKNCATAVSENLTQNPENVVVDFNRMVDDYKRALAELEYPSDEVLRQDFEIIFYRYSHLIRQTENTVLEPMTNYILGDSAMRANNENLFMVGPVLLSKIVFKYKDSIEITQYAWVRLQESIRFGYTGSSGDNTPRSWSTLLKDMSYIVTSNT